MRISTAWRYFRLAREMTRLDNQMYALQVQISTGKRVNRPSDDPVGAATILLARAFKGDLEQQKRTIAHGHAMLRYADHTIGEMVQSLKRIRDLLLRGANSTITPEAYAALATEVESISRRMVELANAHINGRYIFAGRLDKQIPFIPSGDPDAPIAYQGDSESLRLRLGESVLISVTTPGDWLFNFEDAAGNRAIPGVDQDLFAFLEDCRQALESRDQQQISSMIPILDKFLTHVLKAQAKVGIEDRRLEVVENSIGDASVRAAETLSVFEDCDMAETLTRLRMLEVVYQAALSAAAKAASLPSLVELPW